MLGKWSRFLVLAAALALMAGSVLVNRKIDETYFSEPPVLNFLPKPEFVRYLTLGYDKAAGGLLFISMLGNITWKQEPPEYSRWLYNTSRTINYLDPKFFGPYQLAAYALRPQGPEGEDMAIDIMSRASEIYAGWEPLLMVSMIYLMDKKDREMAAKWMALASKRKDAPPSAARIAAGILHDADPHAALELFLESFCIAPIPQRKTILLRDFMAYYRATALTPAERKAYLEEFVIKLESPDCAPPAGGTGWITDELREEIRGFIQP